MRRLVALLLVVCVLSPVVAGPTSAQGTYTVVDLGSFAATGDATAACADSYAGRALALNTEGVVTGRTGWGERTGTAFRATDGAIKRLKGGKGGAGGRDINAGGQVAGYVVDDVGDDPCSMTVLSGQSGAHHAATWVGGELQVLPDDGVYSEAVAINDDGVIAGFVSVKTKTEDGTTILYSSDPRPVVWRDGDLEELALPADGVSGYAFHINAAGDILGVVYDADDVQFDVLWDDGKAILLPEGFVAGAINDDGVVVGSTDGGTGAARLVDGELEPLPGIPDDAISVNVASVNADGDVLGRVATESGAMTVIWQGDEMIDVESLLPADAGFASVSPSDLNDTGMVLLNVTTEDGEPHGIVLIPEGT